MATGVKPLLMSMVVTPEMVDECSQAERIQQ